MTVIEENWDYRLKKENTEEIYHEFESYIFSLRDEVLNLNSFRDQNYEVDSRNHDAELKVLSERNKQLRQEIDAKVEEVARQKARYDSFKQDQELLSQEIKDTHEAFLMAKKYYKKFLKIYYKIESWNGDKQTIYLQFFTEVKTDSENYSVRLLRDTKTDNYKLLEINPKIKTYEELNKNLNETNDVPGVLCRVRQSFIRIRKSKKP